MSSTWGAYQLYGKANQRETPRPSSLLGDGSVHFIANSIEIQAWMALAARAEEEVIEDLNY